jgi:hypothetical protein
MGDPLDEGAVLALNRPKDVVVHVDGDDAEDLVPLRGGQSCHLGGQDILLEGVGR